MPPGRNAPCPCGSGKKYKKCCGSNANRSRHPGIPDQIDTPGLLVTAMECHQAGDLDRAEQLYRKIIKIDRENDNALNLLGVIALTRGDIAAAIRYIGKAVSLDPAAGEFHFNLGKAFEANGQVAEAIKHYQQAVAIFPNYIDAHINLGRIFHIQKREQEAISHFMHALELTPSDGSIHGHLAGALLRVGRIAEAIDHYQAGLALSADANRPVLNSNYLFAINYSPDFTSEQIFSAHLDYAREIAMPLAQFIPRHVNPPIEGKKIRVGYVSADFKAHSVSYFIEPVFASHDDEHYEIFAYYNRRDKDDVSHMLKSYVHQWCDIIDMSDSELSARIQQDGIDILVDLSGHTANNRLLLFARKPAPIQVTWLGYPNTTGLSTIDYRITDSYADPVDITDRYYTEQLIRLPESFSCYHPPQGCPKVSRLPALSTGVITFGSFNNLAKVTQNVIEVWSRILQKVKNSRLMLKTDALSEDAVRKKILMAFKDQGIDENQLLLLGSDPSQLEHLQRYSMVDVALDTFPYNGTTTTCEALWMGVPVVTLEGEAHVSRVGVSQMNNLGLPELIAVTEDEYVDVAAQLAAELDLLSQMRMSLRERMSASPLMNSPRFTRYLEAAYRKMWIDWCRNAIGPS